MYLSAEKTECPQITPEITQVILREEADPSGIIGEEPANTQIDSISEERMIEIAPALTPTPSPTNTPWPAIAPTEVRETFYTVEEGDSCWYIAAKFNISVYDLIEANNMTEACPILIGDKLVIPENH